MDIYLYDKDTRSVTFSEFINKELVLFSNTDNERSIPSLVDGLKPGQRKVIILVKVEICTAVEFVKLSFYCNIFGIIALSFFDNLV